MTTEAQPTGEERNESRWRRGWRRLRTWLARAGEAVRPGPRIRRGVLYGTLTLAAVTAVFFGTEIDLGFGAWIDVPLGILICALATIVAGLACALGIKIVQMVPQFVPWWAIILLGGAVGGAMVVSPFFLLLVAPFALVAPVLGGALAAALGGGLREAGRAKRVVILAAAVGAVGALGFLLYFYTVRGSDAHLVTDDREPPAVAPLAVPDPSRPGPYPVATLTYGSGFDQRRPEFGAEADLTTETVDGTPFLKGSEGWRIKLRHWYWGFDFEALPLNGRVWYPQGEGPFPLVLVVHGNHRMQEYSDPGYAYLGELLASRGMITVSVDENFLNGDLSNESDCRAWLLLRHLTVWREWNRTPENPFFGRVDLDRLALVGHSRGGEAVAIAGAFNRLSHYPDDATVDFDFGFHLRGLVAIAPADGQYEPGDRPTRLANLSYLVLQGAHDADASVFAGARQFRRLRFDDGRYHFKASLYSYRANHGQFNTVWGDRDFGWPLSLLLNRRPLLDGDEQRRISKVTISAFLEATLHDRQEYVALFRDHRAIADWLPKDLYITRFADSTLKTVGDFEEDVDVTTATVDGATIRGEHLAVWREQFLDYRKWGSKRNGVVYLGWRRTEGEEEDSEEPIASYSIDLPEGLAADWGLGGGVPPCQKGGSRGVQRYQGLSADKVLVFSLADADEELPAPDEEEGEEEEGKDEDEDEEGEGKDREPPDLTVELVADGIRVRLPLSRFRLIPAVLKSRFTKLPTEEFAYGEPWEPALQTFELPLAAFAAADPGFDASRLAAIGFVFDRTPEGVIILDDVGFATPPGR